MGSTNHTPCRHPGEGRDTRQHATGLLLRGEPELTAGTRFTATLSITRAFAGVTAVGGGQAAKTVEQMRVLEAMMWPKNP